MERMEPKSYQACITKALVRSGFERGTGSGRFIKWQVPPLLGSDDNGEEGGAVDGEDEPIEDEGGDEQEEEGDDDEEEEEADDGEDGSEPDEEGSGGGIEEQMHQYPASGGPIPS